MVWVYAARSLTRSEGASRIPRLISRGNIDFTHRLSDSPDGLNAGSEAREAAGVAVVRLCKALGAPSMNQAPVRPSSVMQTAVSNPSETTSKET